MMTLASVVLLLAILSFSLQIIIWLFFYSTLRKVQTYKGVESPVTPVSVIICARNESQNLSENISCILEQRYPVFEVIVVDHASEDDTRKVISELSTKYDHLRYIYCDDPSPSKRPALMQGLSASTYEHVLVTDADCKPASDEWIRLMMEPFACGYNIVLAAAPLAGDQSLLSCFVKNEAAQIYMQYATATINGYSYMGVGRNMAYIKKLYPTEISKSFDQYLGGDDDLFISSSHPMYKIALVNDPRTMVWSQGPLSWTEYYQKKHRHVSVSWAYSWWQKTYLAVFSSSHWGFLLFSTAMFLLNIHLSLALCMVIVKIGISLYVMKTVASPFVRKCPISNLFISEFIYLLHYPMIALYLSIKPPKKW